MHYTYDHKKKYWLYVLKLEQGKYYVGVTTRNISRRVEEHKRGFMGAKWTRKYKPIKVLDKKDLGLMTFEQAEKYETRVTMKYMDKYGVNNVRGGVLTYEGSYKYIFGRYFKDDDYAVLKYIVFSMGLMIIMCILWYRK